MVKLSEEKLEPGLLTQAHERLDIPWGTLRSWRRDILEDPTYRPYSRPANVDKRALTGPQERRVYDQLQEDYIKQGRYCPPRVLQFLAVREYRRGPLKGDVDEEYDEHIGSVGSDSDDFSDEEPPRPGEEPARSGDESDEEPAGSDDEPDEEPPGPDEEPSGSDDEYDAEAPQEDDQSEGTEAEEEDDLEFSDDEDADDRPPAFVAGRHWRRDFMRRHGLSLRKPHPKRRPKTEPEEAPAFQARLARIRRRYPPELTFNMDETSWKQIVNGAHTIADKGAEKVNCIFQGDPKTCLTAIASIDAGGGKLPLWILARGKTVRCEARYRNHDAVQAAIARGDLVLGHQQNGWSNATVMAKYLQWLRARCNSLHGKRGRRPRRILLLWDIFASHRCQETKDLASLLSIRLEFIPAGMTGECQPLDRRIFGNLKSRARRRYDEMCAQGEDPTMEDSVAMLVDAWKSIGQFEVLDSWEPGHT
jgi:hypothetical protein